ncbi:hypothetical protein ACRW9N_09935 [Listeria aquatica]|uniref:hypothetical protein n=1 Tax=Listeria aquatica TaxID=1494960 RepID=UPI003EF3B1CA
MSKIEKNTETAFTSYEEAIFKAYLEENTVKSENNFEFSESNLSYYSSRYTSEEYFSPYEFAHVNGFYHQSSEFSKNKKLLEKAKKWHIETVHPTKSEYVSEGDKYVPYIHAPKQIKSICEQLLKAPSLDFYSTELLLVHKDKIYQYLPQKEFLFKWKDNIGDRKQVFEQEQGFLFEEAKLELERDSVILFPIFIPIREILFLGEAGYREALLKHGAILHYLEYQLSEEKLEYFSTKKLNDWLQIDGVERSVMNYFINR